MKPIITIFILLLVARAAFSQAPAIQWAKSYGGINEERATSIQETGDTGYIIAGWSKSNNGDVTGHHGSTYYWDGWIVKINPSGSLEWEKSYGGSYSEFPKSIRLTSDGGYIFVSDSYSKDGDVTGHHGSTDYSDIWVVKLDAEGNIEWEKSYGGTSHESAYDIRPTFDGGYIVAASSLSFNGDVTGHHGQSINYDYWIVKLDSTGDIQWAKTYGGSGNEEPCSILQTADSGYVVSGYSESNDGDVTGHHGSLNSRDIWIIKLDKNGKLTGERSLPNWDSQTPFSMCFSKDSGYVIASVVESFPKHGILGHGNGDFGVYELSKRGVVDTVCAMGGSNNDDPYSIIQTKDKGYVLAGQTLSFDGDITGFHGFIDEWIVKLDSNLKFQWEKCLGGTGPDVAYSVEQTDDDGYIIAGESDSYNGDVTGSHGTGDFWIVKLAPDHTAAVVASTASSNDSNKNLLIYPNPSNNQVNVSFPFSKNIITISDLFGRELRQWKIESGKLKMMDVSFLQQGVYVVEIKDEKGVLIAEEKLFKE